MRLGMIVRADTTGLGNQTWEIWRHLKPEVTIGLDFSRLPDHLPQRREMYPGGHTIWTTWKGVGFNFDNPQAYRMLKTCDLIFSVETFYDLRIPKMNVPGVLYVNPELFRGYGSPTYWAPTDWLIDHLPDGTRVVPFPVATDRMYQKGTGFLHVAGRTHDRNGTRAAATACHQLGIGLNTTHQISLPSMQGARQVGDVGDYWDLYQHGDTLIMPRRYGGMSLPVQEALAAGLTVIMTDIAPNRRWPVKLIPGTHGTTKTVARFAIPTCNVHVGELKTALRTIDDWRWELVDAQAEWVAANSWDTLLPVWQEALEDAAQ
ncbi:MAG: glycosyltransferase family 4 protein [bacterium]|nr:glycosyltransferase family 4 protein [bacterium]